MIIKSKSLRSVLFIFFLFFSSILYAQEPKNLTLTKKELIAYHDSGAYLFDIKSVTNEARQYLLKTINENKSSSRPKKLAIVFDIDETVISNYAQSKKMNFGGTPKQIDKMTITGTKAPIIPVQKLYNLVKKNKVAAFLSPFVLNINMM